MSAIQEYDCPNCGGPLTFDPSSAAWKCDYCFSKFNKEEIDEIFGQDKQEDATEEKGRNLNRRMEHSWRPITVPAVELN